MDAVAREMVVRVAEEMAAAVVDTRVTDSNMGIDIRTDSFDI